MENKEIDIEELKNSKEFLANLELLEDEMNSQKSIQKGYQLLDSLLLIESEEDKINEIFSFIVNNSFDTLSNKLVAHQSFNMKNSEEIATARAIYEHGVSLYSENSFKSAKEIFLVLNFVIDNKELQDAMMIHAISTMKSMKFDDFMENIADTSRYDENDEFAYFVKFFKVDTQKFFDDNQKYLDKANKELKVLKSS